MHKYRARVTRILLNVAAAVHRSSILAIGRHAWVATVKAREKVDSQLEVVNFEKVRLNELDDAFDKAVEHERTVWRGVEAELETIPPYRP